MGALEPLGFVLLLIPLCVVGCAVSLIQRFRRSRGVERLQLKWLTYAVAVVTALFLIGFPLDEDSLWVRVLLYASVSSFAPIPVAAGIAILRHRLFDIDVVIKKTLVFGP